MAKMTNAQKIEASRNNRLWISQVIVPTATMICTMIVAIPEARQAAVNGYYNTKEFFAKKFHKVRRA